MGFGSLATYVILFTVGVAMATGLMFTFRDYFSTSSSSIEVRQSISHARMASAMEIRNISYNSDGMGSTEAWETTEDFQEGIFDNTTAEDDSVVLEGENTTGVWYSDVREFNGPSDITSLSAGGLAVQPDSVKIKVRTAEDRGSLTGPFLGPDGTDENDDFYELEDGQDANDIHSGDSVVQVAAWFNDTVSEDPSHLDYIILGYEYEATLNVTIRNRGNIELDEEKLDFFIVGDRVSRDSVLDMSVVEEEGMPNPGIWDTEADLALQFAIGSLSGDNLFTVTNEFGARDSLRFNAEGD